MQQEELFHEKPLPPFELRKVLTFRNYEDIPNNREILHVYEAVYPGPFFFSPKEVAEEPVWMDWQKLIESMKAHPELYTGAFHNIMKEYVRLKDYV